MLRQTHDIDTETGEIIKSKQVQFNIFDEKKGYLFKARNYKKIILADIKLSQIVNNQSDFMRVHLLSEWIYKDTNMVYARIDSRKIKAADISDIAEIIKLSDRRTKEFLKCIIQKDIIAKRNDKIGCESSEKYYFNPLFFSSNKYLNADLYFLFQRSLDEHLPSWVIRKFNDIKDVYKK